MKCMCCKTRYVGNAFIAADNPPPTKVRSYSPSASVTVTLNLKRVKIHDIIMPAGNIIIAIANEINGHIFSIRILQDKIGNRTVRWFSTIKWVGGIVPVLTATGNKADTFVFRVTGTNAYDGFIVGQNI